MHHRLSRRTALKAIGSLGIGITTGSALATTAAAGDHTFARQLNTVRAATRKYRDVATARADGYRQVAVIDLVGAVFNNSDNLGNIGHTDPPANLFYAPNRSGDIDDSDLILAGIEYHVEGRHDDPPVDIFDDETAARRLKVSEADGWHPNPFGGDFTGLHVWPHLQNPAGVFALAHPTIRDRLTD